MPPFGGTMPLLYEVNSLTWKEPGKVHGRRTLMGEPACTVPEPKERDLAGSAWEAVAWGTLAPGGKMMEHGPGWPLLLGKMGLHGERAQEGGG